MKDFFIPQRHKDGQSESLTQPLLRNMQEINKNTKVKVLYCGIELMRVTCRPWFNLNLFAAGMDLSMGQERRTPVTPSSSSRYHRRRSSGSRDERYRSGKRLWLHTWGTFCLSLTGRRVSLLLSLHTEMYYTEVIFLMVRSCLTCWQRKMC